MAIYNIILGMKLKDDKKYTYVSTHKGELFDRSEFLMSDSFKMFEDNLLNIHLEKRNIYHGIFFGNGVIANQIINGKFK